MHCSQPSLTCGGGANCHTSELANVFSGLVLFDSRLSDSLASPLGGANLSTSAPHSLASLKRRSGQSERKL